MCQTIHIHLHLPTDSVDVAASPTKGLPAPGPVKPKDQAGCCEVLQNCLYALWGILAPIVPPGKVDCCNFLGQLIQIFSTPMGPLILPMQLPGIISVQVAEGGTTQTAAMVSLLAANGITPT